MPVAYRHIRTASWTPSTAEASVVRPYRAMPFPETWRDTVLELCNAGRRPGTEPWRTAPTRSLEQVLQAFAPDVLVMPRRPGPPSGEPPFWLYAAGEDSDPLPQKVLVPLVHRWLGDLCPDPAQAGALREARIRLAAAPPHWESVERELLSGGATRGGTFVPGDHQFTLTTDWLARRILALEPYEHAAGTLRFRAMPRGPRDRGAELVSEPMSFSPGRPAGTWWYSICLNITLQTVPFDPLPRFHLHWFVRRWATRLAKSTERVHLPWGSRTTVLLRPRVPVLPGVPRSSRFAVAQLERVRDRETGRSSMEWAHGGPARLLAGIPLGEGLPEPDLLLSAPEELLREDMRAALVHRTAMGGHAVKPGLMPNQCSMLTEWAEQALPDELRRTPALTHTTIGATRPVNAPPTVTGADKLAEADRKALERRRALAFALASGGPGEDPPVFEARLIWQTETMRETVVEALVERLGLPPSQDSRPAAEFDGARSTTPVVLTWRTPELVVRLSCHRPVGSEHGGGGTPVAFAGPLDVPEGRVAPTAHTHAVERRRGEVTRWLGAPPPGAAPRLALVEIDHPEDFPGPRHDPKFALRLGFADSGFVTQFLLVPRKAKGRDTERNRDHRALMAWEDGFRQLGARVHPEAKPLPGVPEGLRFAAVWMVRKNRTDKNRWAVDVPVAVLVTPAGDGSGRAAIEGWDPDADAGAGAWVPYPAMLLRLARMAEVGPRLPSARAPEGDGTAAAPRPGRYAAREEQRRRAEEWLQRMRATLRRQPTLLMVDAQNARSHWTWLQDGRTEPDRIRDGHAEARRLPPELRLLRTRSHGDRETPQWWGMHPQGGVNGMPSHVWIPEGDETGRVFYSTTPKPVQFKSSAVEADKLAPRPIRMGPRKGQSTIDTGEVGWRPSLLELAVLGCHEDEGDDPQALALTAHLLRQPPDYPEALGLPFPLHLAGLGQQYVLPTEAREDHDREAAAEDDPVAFPAAGLAEENDNQADGEEQEGQLSLFPA
ncbi:pPIWI_RE module domain-containing protein [Streptomyces sp. NPDC004126]|uniref:pPIWI_RE module domain-containing protein n=1 Tax=Streptomyces sp. NPDC004126 TaxID=3390695 RepID=UPI003CFFE80C